MIIKDCENCNATVTLFPEKITYCRNCGYPVPKDTTPQKRCTNIKCDRSQYPVFPIFLPRDNFCDDCGSPLVADVFAADYEIERD